MSTGRELEENNWKYQDTQLEHRMLIDNMFATWTWTQIR